MPNLGMFAQPQVLVAAATITTNTTSAAMSIPPAQSYRFLFSVNTVSGTSPTLIATIATSFDGGTTFNDILTSTTLSATGGSCAITVRPYLGNGEIATVQATTLTSITTSNPTAGTVANGPIDWRYIKVKYVVGGTSPSFAVTTALISIPQDLSD